MKKKGYCRKDHKLTPDNISIRPDGKRRCKKCEIAYRKKNKERNYIQSRKWALENPERMRGYWQKWDRKNYQKKLVYRREKWFGPYHKKLKLETLTHYGNGKLACVCCDENEIKFLTIDHIKGRQAHEKNNPQFGGGLLRQYLRSHGYPKGYQTLCWNCNSGRATNSGICPHKTNLSTPTQHKPHIKNPSKHTMFMRSYHPKYVKQLKTEVLTHYGKGSLACLCCGVNKLQFLTLDHIDGRTKEEKKNIKKRGWQYLQYLKSHGYPQGYQTLCWNCNSGRSLNKGICPHKSKANLSLPEG